MAPTSINFKEDLKAVPEDVRQSAREADQKLEEMAGEKPAFGQALDLRLVAVVAAVALVVAFLLRLAGLGLVPALGLFLILFLGGWFVAVHAAAPRPPNR